MQTVELGTQHVMILAGDRLDVTVQRDGLRGDVVRWRRAGRRTSRDDGRIATDRS
ncbi:hypothetical protein MOP88_10975 [Sphingomonas sp. WKB10]|nr:hypothetical protein [Sphingomonas sp. WKB10]